jgi:glycosyltransferase involved in cell wall biosynthesis
MKFLFICGREVDYTRNQVLLRAFTRIGDVDTVVEYGPARSIVLRSARIAWKVLPKFISKRYDLIFVGFYGHLLMLPVGLLSRRPILFDAFVSSYDTLTSDRQTYSPNSIMGRLSILLDRTACKLTDKVLVDTSAQESYFSSFLGIPPEKLSSLPVSCNEDIFFPRSKQEIGNHQLLILSYSTYLPIHGMDTIIAAAEKLRDEPIQFKLIGAGPLYAFSRQYAEDHGLTNITFSPAVPLERLADEIVNADICLGGHFGPSKKATRVVPGKIYQMLAMGKPIIAADSVANRALLQHGISAYLCPPGDPTALANSIMSLSKDSALLEKIGFGGREAFMKCASEAVVTEGLRRLVSQMINRN